MERAEVEAQIREAFAGVGLGSGVSLRQAAAIDRYLEGITQAEFDRLPDGEVTDDWTRIPLQDLAKDNIAYLDAEGLRYYLPALMLWLLDNHDRAMGSIRATDDELMTAIGTLAAIAPISEPAMRLDRYRLFEAEFSEAQRIAIAVYVQVLPDLVHLNDLDAAYLDGATREYWHRYLPA
jgi:hypothetical protein